MYSLLIVLICFFGFKVALVLITAPILASYGAAYNFYSITGDASYFVLAKDMTISWLTNIVLLCLSLATYKIIKYKKEKKNE